MIFGNVIAIEESSRTTGGCVADFGMSSSSPLAPTSGDIDPEQNEQDDIPPQVHLNLYLSYARI